MATKNLLRTFTILSMVLCTSNVFSQKWDKHKPDILYATDKNGDTTNVKVGIGTDNPQYPLEVKGKIVADSMQILGRLKIGTGSLILDLHLRS